MIKIKQDIYRTSVGLETFVPQWTPSGPYCVQGFVVYTPQWTPTGAYCVQDGGSAAPVMNYDTTASPTPNNGFDLFDITASTSLIANTGIDSNGTITLVAGHQYQVSTRATSGSADETAHCDINVDSLDVVTSTTTHLFDASHTGVLTSLIAQYTFNAASNKIYTVTGSSFVGETL